MTPLQEQEILDLCAELDGFRSDSIADAAICRIPRTWFDLMVRSDPAALILELREDVQHKQVIDASGIHLGGHVTFPVAGIVPAASPGGLTYSPDGADEAGYTAPMVYGTVIEDARERDGSGPLVVRVDADVVWTGQQPGGHRPRDFRRGDAVVATADKLTRDELEETGLAWQQAQIEAAKLTAPARERVQAAVLRAHAAGLTEVQIAARVHTTRTTVRALLGKPAPRSRRR